MSEVRKNKDGKVVAFTIDRAKWLSGDTFEKFGEGVVSRMKDTKGRMCCLGFYADACGAKGMVRNGAKSPEDVTALPEQAAYWLVEAGDVYEDRLFDTSIAEELMSINDNDFLDPSERESDIKRIFKEEAGVTVKFKGRYPRTPDQAAV